MRICRRRTSGLAPEPAEVAWGQASEALEDGSEVCVVCEAGGEGNLGEGLIGACEHFDGGIDAAPAKVFSDA
jgi:hypothetical protein